MRWSLADAADGVEEQFSAGATDSPVSGIVGAGPALVEACEVVGVAEGGAGFLAAPSYG